MKQKGNILIGIIIGIGLCLIAYLIYTDVIYKETKEITDETANWNVYKNENYDFEIKYPENWKVAKNIFTPLSYDPLVFCPDSLLEPDPDIICKIKEGGPGFKPSYEDGMIYLFTYDAKEIKLANNGYYYLGTDKARGISYYLVSSDSENKPVIDLMVSTFKIYTNQDVNLKKVGEELFSDYLNQYLSEELVSDNDLKSYKINNIDVYGVKDQCFIFGADFSVEPFNIYAWEPGNGIVEGDWVANKYLYVDVVKENNNYVIKKVIGTGSSGNDCDKY